jgi:hypothetical protein
LPRSNSRALHDKWAEEEFKAETPEQALALARAFYDDHDEELIFQSYDGGMPVTEIEISGEDGGELAIWRDKTLSLHLAAQSLLDACKVAIDRLEMNNYEGEEVLARIFAMGLVLNWPLKLEG